MWHSGEAQQLGLLSLTAITGFGEVGLCASLVPLVPPRRLFPLRNSYRVLGTGFSDCSQQSPEASCLPCTLE